MEYAWVLVVLCVGPAFIATLLAIWFEISAALTGIVGETIGLGTTFGWGRFSAITGATVRAFGRTDRECFEYMVDGSPN